MQLFVRSRQKQNTRQGVEYCRYYNFICALLTYLTNRLVCRNVNVSTRQMPFFLVSKLPLKKIKTLWKTLTF